MYQKEVPVEKIVEKVVEVCPPCSALIGGTFAVWIETVRSLGDGGFIKECLLT